MTEKEMKMKKKTRWHSTGRDVSHLVRRTSHWISLDFTGARMKGKGRPPFNGNDRGSRRLSAYHSLSIFLVPSSQTFFMAEITILFGESCKTATAVGAS